MDKVVGHRHTYSEHNSNDIQVHKTHLGDMVLVGHTVFQPNQMDIYMDLR